MSNTRKKNKKKKKTEKKKQKNKQTENPPALAAHRAERTGQPCIQ